MIAANANDTVILDVVLVREVKALGVSQQTTWPSPLASAASAVGVPILTCIIRPSIRGTAVGSLLGVLPGGGATLSSFVAYNLEKQVSRNSAEFGHGAIEGVAAPEAANNAGAQTSFIPMLSLGIPSNVIMAMMMGAMIMQGISPGPNVVTQYPDLFWGLIVSASAKCGQC